MLAQQPYSGRAGHSTPSTVSVRIIQKALSDLRMLIYRMRNMIPTAVNADNLRLQELSKKPEKPRVPSPPPPAHGEEAMLDVDIKNKKKMRRKLEKAHLAGQKIDNNVFRAIYGAEVIVLMHQHLLNVSLASIQ